jgi:chromosome segregation ATPase
VCPLPGAAPLRASPTEHQQLDFTGGYEASAHCAWDIRCEGDQAALLRFTELDTEAGRLRESCAAVRPGRRLDDLESFVGRCEGRLAKATQATADAWAEMERAQLQEKDAEKELKKATDDLDKLRDDVAAGAAEDSGKGGGAEAGAAAEAELAALRGELAQAQAERDNAVAAAPAAAEAEAKAAEELGKKLADARAALARVRGERDRAVAASVRQAPATEEPLESLEAKLL